MAPLRIRLTLAVVAATTLLGVQAWAQLPATYLESVYPAGAKQGTTLEVIVAGADMDGVSQLHFSHEGIKAKQKTRDPKRYEQGPQPVDNTFEVTVAGNVPVGTYECRAIGIYGISNPRAFQVSNVEEVQEDNNNNSIEAAKDLKLGTIVNGRSDANADLDFYKFTAKAGQRLIFDCWSERLDARMDATLVVLDAEGHELVRDRDSNRRDPLLDFTAPRDGDYFLKVYDFLYQGGNEYFYRLAANTGPYIDYVLPPAGQAGKKEKFTLFGRNLPGGSPSGVKIDGVELQKLDVEIDVPGGDASRQLSVGGVARPEDLSVDGFEYRLGTSNPVTIGFVTAPAVAEKDPNDKVAEAQKLSLPCEVYGQFFPRRDQDWFQFDAKAGEVYYIEVISQRLGQPTDPFLLVQQITKNDKGEEQVKDLQAADDDGTNLGGTDFPTNTDDPTYKLTVPADGTYRVLVRDLYYGSRGDPRYIYRLAIRKPQEDFRLVALCKRPGQNNQQSRGSAMVLRKGGNEMVEVMAFRQDGYEGEITVTAEGLPGGVTCQPAVIGPKMSTAQLVLQAADGAAEWAGTVRIVGKAKINNADTARVARAGTIVWTGQNNQSATRSRMDRDLALCVLKEQAPFVAVASTEKPWETSRAGKLEIPIKVTRRGEYKGNLALKAINLPREIKVNNITINGDKGEGNVTVELANNAPVGTYSFALVSETDVPYERNKEAAEAAEQDKKRLEEAIKQLDAANKKAAQEKQQADKAAQDAANALKQATDNLNKANQEEANANKAKADAANKAKQAADALSGKPDDQGLKDAKAAADKALDEATKKATAATEAKTKAAKAVEDANAAKKTADEAKTKAEQTAKAADAELKEAQREQQQVNKRAQDLKNASNKKNIKVYDPTTVITIKITEAPITLAAQKPGGNLKQGAKLELPVSINRLYGYDEEVQVEVTPPRGVQGLKIDNPKIGKGAKDTKVTIEAAANATVGTHEITVKATARFNNQNLQVTETIPLTIEKVEQQAKK